MKIEPYISVLVVLVVGLFLVALWPEATFAEVQSSTAPNSVQCNAPVNTWCVPATAGAGVPGTFCSTYAPNTAVPARRVVTRDESLWGVLGSIVEVPFVAAQCILAGCP